MAAGSLLTLLDDIATLLDDVSVMTKVAAKKTAGVLGDDLALNAQQVTGVRAERELPVVWAVFKGSALNKLVMVPAALFLSAVFPWIITPLLMLGGAFLCYEGFEKVVHRLLHPPAEDRKEHARRIQALADRRVNMAKFEKQRIRGAIRTDAILSAEIIVIALGTVRDADLAVRIGVVSSIAALMTVGVYGLVAGIVKLDDVGLHLHQAPDDAALVGAKRGLGRAILAAAPYLMKGLAIAGTAAMFLVGGGILSHGVPPLFDAIKAMAQGAGALGWLLAVLADAIVGIVAGALVLAAVTAIRKLSGRA